MSKDGKKYKQALTQIDTQKAYALAEGLYLAKKIAFAKFDEKSSWSV